MFQTVLLECHQQRSFTLKMHQNRWRLALRPRPHWWSLQRSPRPHSWFRGGAPGKGSRRKGKRKGERGRGERGREGREGSPGTPKSKVQSYKPCYTIIISSYFRLPHTGIESKLNNVKSCEFSPSGAGSQLHDCSFSIHPSIHLFVHKTHNEKCKKDDSRTGLTRHV